ncbi:manganese-dependent ADP-ribose/CDP-alcohol diphosphatase-like [Biomphalaria glabrata]|uniref:Manganese-dependent ADP-ribose/CDP-alcohol diphosphatase-like n=1 Tax=Biomphalaria glabrata TaxID=6526 RepID=A0A9W3BE85_BIOGL|nr:manganese-dependent ADP-ribose/CDP-alcohol diphosphatase-like [Biomphalaria glabrata]XP_055897756.1 manganese-dependent ADP-ribose/CDP-alcohol diphosphatase-like [Biomphalaria glabrata]
MAEKPTNQNVSLRRVHLTFGIVTDIQYADCKDGMDYTYTRRRYYRNALNQVKAAILCMSTNSHAVSFLLQLGDIIDRKSSTQGAESCRKALNSVLNVLSSLHRPIYHVIGNHDLQCFPRTFYIDSLLKNISRNMSSATFPHLHYTFLAHEKLRVVALDTFEISVLGYEDQLDNVSYKLAQEMIRAHNPNVDTSDITGLEGVNRRWASYNGGVSKDQLQWLAQVLEKAKSCEENIIIITHVPVVCDDDQYLAWNFSEIVDVIAQFECVIGVFSGHRHEGGSSKVGTIHHITFPGIIETPPEVHAFAVLQMTDTDLEIIGVGRVPCYRIPLCYPVK